MRGLARVGAVLLLAVAPAAGSDVDLSRLEGHPRGRLPLTVHLASLGDPVLDAAAHRTIGDWNAVARGVLGREVFTEISDVATAQVRLIVEPADGTRLMGQTFLEADAGGVISLPVRIVVFQPRARGATAVDVVAYAVVAHELGHALGLPHTTEVRSLMCCVAGSVDFRDPAQRDAYVEARRHPEVRSVERQLGEHYRRFWSGAP
ncbi:MAG: matrixin family metalloprotease [Candidatus Rokubacteria bacterium]|nr:matrixin family metalloprotease [Candidatus Rokubacteria bacterium]